MLTHEEATKEICPYSFASSIGPVKCIGNRCPMWKVDHNYIYNVRLECREQKICDPKKQGSQDCDLCPKHFGICGGR